MDANITLAQYIKAPFTEDVSAVRAVIDGELWFVPIDPANRHYTEIMRQVEAGELVIQEALDA